MIKSEYVNDMFVDGMIARLQSLWTHLEIIAAQIKFQSIRRFSDN